MHVNMFLSKTYSRKKPVWFKSLTLDLEYDSEKETDERDRVGQLRDISVCQRNPPYSGTCPVPLFSSSLTRLPPALMSSMARAWVMSRVLSPLISMIWSPTWRRHRVDMVDSCQTVRIHVKLTFLCNHCLCWSNWGISATKCLVQMHFNRSCCGWAEGHSVNEFIHLLTLPLS